MSKTFPQESFETFLNLKKSALRRTKKTCFCVLTECFEKHLKKDMVLFGFSKINFLALSHLF